MKNAQATGGVEKHEAIKNLSPLGPTRVQGFTAGEWGVVCRRRGLTEKWKREWQEVGCSVAGKTMHSPTSSLRSVDESVAEGIPEKETRFDDEEADVQRALEESLKSIYDVPWGPLPWWRTSIPTGSSGHDESSLLYVKLGLADNEVESDEDVLGIDAGVQGKGQVGPNPDEQDKDQARPNPGDVVASQPLPSPVVHVGPNLEHMDLEVTNVSTQPHPE
uniref:Uncharacterized protein n=1 Tax=Tanacetum cinerariifolium TaxID=118510 RepID=A0A699GMA6_TANCI|nr:hypothetical protein [Tanacetum cinerariifolium]